MWSTPVIVASVATPALATSSRYRLSLSAATSTIPQAGSTNVTAILVNDDGTPRAGESVAFSVSALAGVSLNTLTRVSDAAGQAKVRLSATAGAALGTVTVTATSRENVARVSVSVTGSPIVVAPGGTMVRYPVASTRNTPSLGWGETAPVFALRVQNAAGAAVVGATVKLTITGTKRQTSTGALSPIPAANLAWGNGVQAFVSQGTSFTTTTNANGDLVKSWPLYSTFASVGLVYPDATYSFSVHVDVTAGGTVTSYDVPLSIERILNSNDSLFG